MTPVVRCAIGDCIAVKVIIGRGGLHTECACIVIICNLKGIEDRVPFKYGCTCCTGNQFPTSRIVIHTDIGLGATNHDIEVITTGCILYIYDCGIGLVSRCIKTSASNSTLKIEYAIRIARSDDVTIASHNASYRIVRIDRGIDRFITGLIGIGIARLVRIRINRNVGIYRSIGIARLVRIYRLIATIIGVFHLACVHEDINHVGTILFCIATDIDCHITFLEDVVGHFILIYLGGCLTKAGKLRKVPFHFGLGIADGPESHATISGYLYIVLVIGKEGDPFTNLRHYELRICGSKCMIGLLNNVGFFFHVRWSLGDLIITSHQHTKSEQKDQHENQYFFHIFLLHRSRSGK